ncbi:MAG: hypothetical protein JF887_03095 [Candidatus Dormibacteraeota bacterium]|uniref:Uncharacterized protein n=1 Tax=Candidatus Amunia macphersoniae TaxID=3127014 RepID=A0A934NFQ6_9BACT|nr:hypothetical protein [Candidatus Dormibacteraeota bacterium]
MPVTDPVAVIEAATVEAVETGHDLRGFTRRTGSFGYRFEARCVRCDLRIAVARTQGQWAYQHPLAECAGEGT